MALRLRLNEFLSAGKKVGFSLHAVCIANRGRLGIRSEVPTMSPPGRRPQYMVATGVKCIPQLSYIGLRPVESEVERG